jgi:hypothetical protein
MVHVRLLLHPASRRRSPLVVHGVETETLFYRIYTIGSRFTVLAFGVDQMNVLRADGGRHRRESLIRSSGRVWRVADGVLELAGILSSECTPIQ